MLLLPIILALIGAEANKVSFFALCSALSLGVFLYRIFDLLEQSQGHRVFLVAALSTAAWTTLGFLQSAVLQAELGIRDFSHVFGSALWIRFDIREYAWATAFLYTFVLVCELFSKLPAVRRLEDSVILPILSRLKKIKDSSWTCLFAAYTALMFALSLGGIFSVRGFSDQVEGVGGRWWFPLIQTLLALLPLMTSWTVLRVKSLFSWHFIVFLLGLPIVLFTASFRGRSLTVFFLASLIYYALLVEKPSELARRIGKWRLMILAVSSLTFFSIVFSFINFLQFIRQEAGGSSTAFQFLALYFDFLQSSEVQDATETLRWNLLSRPLLLWPLAASIKMSILGINEGYLYFQDIINSSLNSIPGPLYPYKGGLRLAEGLLYQAFPFSDVDAADSPALFAFASFGVLGLIIYPAFMLLPYVSFLLVVRHSLRWAPFLPVSFLCLGTIGWYATKGYSESATTNLIRSFLVPAIFIALLTIASLPFFSPRTRRQSIHSKNIRNQLS